MIEQNRCEHKSERKKARNLYRDEKLFGECIFCLSLSPNTKPFAIRFASHWKTLKSKSAMHLDAYVFLYSNWFASLFSALQIRQPFLHLFVQLKWNGNNNNGKKGLQLKKKETNGIEHSTHSHTICQQETHLLNVVWAASAATSVHIFHRHHLPDACTRQCKWFDTHIKSEIFSPGGVLPRNRKKVVSCCFLHCNANTNKYMHVFAVPMNISGWFGSPRCTHTHSYMLVEFALSNGCWATFLCKLHSAQCVHRRYCTMYTNIHMYRYLNGRVCLVCNMHFALAKAIVEW